MGFGVGDIWDGVEGAVSASAGMAKDTVKSVGKAAAAPITAPAGVIWDIASSPSDWTKDITQGGGNFVTDVFDPLVNQETLTGAIATPIMQGLETVYREGISEPVVTANTVFTSAVYNKDLGSIFSSDSWSQGYQIAQSRSIGQSEVLKYQGLASLLPDGRQFGSDPMDPGAYEDLHEESPLLVSLASGGIDAGVRWYADPGVILGKAGKAAAEARKLRPLSVEEGMKAGRLAKTEKAKRFAGIVPVKGLAVRYDELIGKIDNGVHSPGWLDGKSAAEIYKGYTPFQQTPYGSQMASLLSDAGKIDSPAERINEQRRIMAVFNGDLDTAGRFEEKHKYITDILNNMAGKSLTEQQLSVVADDVFEKYTRMGEQPPFWPLGANPDRVADAEQQIKNLPTIQSWLQKEESRISELLNKHHGQMREVMVPGRKENRILAREVEGKGLTRSGQLNTGIEKVDEAAEKVLAPIRHGIESVYSYSPNAMPVRVIWAISAKPALGITKATAKAPTTLYNSFRNVRPEGFVNVNDSDDSIRQVDAFLRKAGADEQTRADYVSRMAEARESYDRARILTQAEKEVHKIVLQKYGIEDLPGFIEAIADPGIMRRQAIMASMEGRAYSATMDIGVPSKVPAAAGPLGKMQRNAVRQSESRGMDRSPTGLRVDQIDDDGVPVALPFLDTQDASFLPMMDVNRLDDVLKRHHSLVRATARQWKEDMDLGIGTELKRRVGDIGVGAFQQKDRLSDAAIHTLNWLNRTWKFSVLMRLGYPMRVLMDDHMRIGAAFGASVIVNGLKEGGSNFLYNNTLRRGRVWSEARALEARQEILQAELANETRFAANQEAWARIRRIDGKLKTIKSESTRADYMAEREALLNAHPEDLAPLRQELDGIIEMRRNKTYKDVAKRRMGTTGRKSAEGDYLPDAFEGTYGDVYRQVVASSHSWDTLGELSEKQIHAAFARSQSQRVITAADSPATHLHAWAHSLNHQIRNSELANIVLKGGTSDDVLQFLTKTPRGREIARKFPYLGGDPERWAVNVEKMVHEYAPTQELRDMLVNGQVTAKRLDSMFKDVSARPDVHGRVIDANLETGGAASLMSEFQSRFYKRIGQANDSMSRHPLFVTLFRDKQQELYQMRLALAKRQKRQLSSADIEAVTQGAREHAKRQVNRILFEMGSTSEMAHFLRFVSPFFGAWQEGMNRWWRIVSKDPSVVRRFQMAFDAPRHMGLVVDQNGDPVEAGEPINDEHYILLQMPHDWGGPDPSKPGGQTQFKVSESSFNLIFQGGGLFNPGFGPMVQIPVNQMAVHNAEKLTYDEDGNPTSDFAKTVDAILPLGPNKQLFDPIISPSLRNGYAYVGAKWFGKQPQVWRQYEAMIARDLGIEFRQKYDRPPTYAEQQDILKQAGERATAMAGMKFLTSITSPAAVQVQSKFTVEMQAYRKLQEHARENDLGYFWADEQFIKKFGEAFFPILQSSTKNEAALPSTAGTIAQLKKYKDLRNKVSPEVYRMIVGAKGEGAYSQAARVWMSGEEMKAGSSDTFVSYSDPAEAMTDTAVSQGWHDYNQLMNHLNLQAHQMGYKSYLDTPQLVEAKRRGMAVLARRNPQWWQEFNTFNPEEYEARVADMRIIASDSRMKSDPERSDIFALQQYLTLRDEMTRQLKQRARWGLSSSPEAQSNQDLVRGFTRAVSALVESNTYFESYMYNGIIERDPYLAEVA